MVCFDEMDPDKAVVLVNFEGGGSAYSEDLNNVTYSHCNGLVATSRHVVWSQNRFSSLSARVERYNQSTYSLRLRT